LSDTAGDLPAFSAPACPCRSDDAEVQRRAATVISDGVSVLPAWSSLHHLDDVVAHDLQPHFLGGAGIGLDHHTGGGLLVGAGQRLAGHHQGQARSAYLRFNLHFVSSFS
jgi:hypothetical protein